MKHYDAFISYAVEDKEAVTNKLYELLEKKGLKPWYAGYELKIGDDIGKVITAGLNASEFGILIVSPDFLRNPWPLFETARLLAHEKKLLPVWHNISRAEIQMHHPPLTQYWSISTSIGIEEVANKIIEKIKIVKEEERKNRQRRLKKRFLKALIAMVLLLITSMIWKAKAVDHPDDQDIVNYLHKWSMNFDKSTEGNYFNSTLIGEKFAVRNDRLKSVMKNYNYAPASGYNNFYTLDNNLRKVKSKKRTLNALDMNATMAQIFVGFGMGNYKSYLYPQEDSVLILVNDDQMDFELLSVSKINNKELEVRTKCYNNLRMVEVRLRFPKNAGERKKAEYYIHGLWSLETFRLKKKQSSWEAELII